MLSYLYQLNQVDFKQHPRIDPLVAIRNKKYRKLMKGLVKPDRIEYVEYQTLSTPFTILGFGIKTEQDKRAITLNNLMKELEAAYRAFEKSFVSHCLRMQSPSAISS